MRLEELQSLVVALSEPIRLRILHLLFVRDDLEWDVSAIVDILDLSQPTVSRHLARLRDAGLLEFATDGKRRLYRLADQQTRLDQSLLAALEPFVRATPEVQEDLRRAADLTPLEINATRSLHDRDEQSTTEQTDLVFRALKNSIRRTLLDRIQRDPGLSLMEVGDGVPGSRQAVRRHVEVLIEADMVHVVEDGKAKRLYYNAVPLQAVYDRWTDPRSGMLAESMLNVKHAVQAKENADG